VVDHYALDAIWESVLRTASKKIMVIDDLANRQHDCDLLLDQNYYINLEQRYKGLVPEHCITLLGPGYVLLRPEFGEARKRLRVRDGKVSRILVFLGGSDPSNITGKILDVLKQLSLQEITIDVVVGISNPNKNVIQRLCRKMQNAQYHCQVSNMAELIKKADIAIGAGGATTWERCILGLPTLTLVFADNQLQTTLDLDAKGVIKYIGWADKISATEITFSMEQFINNPTLLSNLSKQSLLVMKDWRGGQAVVTEMFNSN
jgi:UDP-2,4-diacetamido-2,4,6-trideoxy-beta-L-altropyranose hydrolase